MRKLKIYLDTSVISHLDQPEKVSEHQHTLALWEILKKGIYDIFVSSVVFQELKRCEPIKQDKLLAALGELSYTIIPDMAESENLSGIIIAEGILPPKSIADSLHIAAAILGGCEYLLTWNFNHLANIATNNGMRIVSLKYNYPQIALVPPTMLLKED